MMKSHFQFLLSTCVFVFVHARMPTLIVTMHPTDPFTMVRRGFVGNERYEGYCVDLLEKIAESLGFQYEIRIVKDGQYGKRSPMTGHWNGMIGELLDGKADLAVAPMAMNTERKSVVDFSEPFLQTGWSVMTAKHPHNDDKKEPIPEIESLEDLANQDVIQYGIQRGGSTHAFFNQSTTPLYDKMWRHMLAQVPSSLMRSYTDGVERVRQSRGEFAFILEDTSNEYVNHREPCDTKRVGQPFHKVVFGIAMPKRSPYKTRVDSVIRDLRERGELKALKQKWWYDRSECKDDATTAHFSYSTYLVAMLLSIVNPLMMR